ncbi:hypothetical protein PF005_g21799 [Phytophthora fragariae]|uniref:Secreted protein n=1 Tax=Phytophthora fragariae TaxID=53985 RepID=A0A6A3WII4_9STRA|nr:hypothetical protein PF005_g21799 [Phytophthora fragariae]
MSLFMEQHVLALLQLLVQLVALVARQSRNHPRVDLLAGKVEERGHHAQHGEHADVEVLHVRLKVLLREQRDALGLLVRAGLDGAAAAAHSDLHHEDAGRGGGARLLHEADAGLARRPRAE